MIDAGDMRDEFQRLAQARRAAASQRRKAVYTRAIDALLDRYNEIVVVTVEES